MNCPKRVRARHGVAAVELAVCLPVVVLLVVATIEACSMVFLKQSLSAAVAPRFRRVLLRNLARNDSRANGVSSSDRLKSGHLSTGKICEATT